jgi:hypothetical protein
MKWSGYRFLKDLTFDINHQQLRPGSYFISERIRILPGDSGVIIPKSQ